MELVLVLGIIAILATIAQPRYGAAVSRYRADLAARRIVQDLALAQAIAKAKGAAQTVSIHQGTDEVVLYDTAALDSHMSTYRTYLSDSPYKADISSSVFDGDNDVIFDGWGLPDSGGTAVLEVGSETRTITIDPNTGKASIE
jgi:type II secretory pathway pseudopilin PulG